MIRGVPLFEQGESPSYLHILLTLTAGQERGPALVRLPHAKSVIAQRNRHPRRAPSGRLLSRRGR
mgnify:CR=1 FL=1